MLTSGLLIGAKLHIRSIVCRRNLGLAAPMLNKASDPIQQLFIDKIREYRKKSNKLADATPEIQKELASELDRVSKHYGGGPGVDMTKFPTFNFTDPPIDPINLEQK